MQTIVSRACTFEPDSSLVSYKILYPKKCKYNVSQMILLYCVKNCDKIFMDAAVAIGGGFAFQMCKV